MANQQACDIVVCEFKLQSYYYADFWTNTLGKGMNSPNPQAKYKIMLLLFFYNDGFGIK